MPIPPPLPPFRLFGFSCGALVATAGFASKFGSERTPGEVRGVAVSYPRHIELFNTRSLDLSTTSPGPAFHPESLLDGPGARLGLPEARSCGIKTSHLDLCRGARRRDRRGRRPSAGAHTPSPRGLAPDSSRGPCGLLSLPAQRPSLRSGGRRCGADVRAREG